MAERSSILHCALSRLSVARKLMLIYLLDLTAVIYVSGILINEKFIAIDFARKEVAGNAYVAQVRGGLLDAARSGLGDAAARQRLAGHVRAAAAEAPGAHGAGTDADEPSLRLRGAQSHAARHGADAGAVDAMLQRGRELLKRVGNQSNLILDPDLDSYHTMPLLLLLLLRYPERRLQMEAGSRPATRARCRATAAALAAPQRGCERRAGRR